MKRRSFVKKTTAGVVGAGIVAGCGSDSGDAGSGGGSSNPRVTWRLASSFSRSLDTIYGAAEVLAERVSAMTGGRFTIRCYPGGELVPALEVLGATQSRTVHMGHTASYYYVGKNPALAFDTGVPFGLTARQQNAWFYHGGGLELMRSVFADFNILNFPGGNTGTQMGGWFRRPVETAADLRGLKMRIPAVGGQVMARLGVNVQLISGGEIYSALERGAIDATEWVGPYDDEKLGLNKIANHYYYPGWWEPSANLSFYVNIDAWNELPENYREILASATAEANVKMLAAYDAKNPAALQRLIDGGTDVRPFSAEILAAAKRETDAYLDENAASDAKYAEILNAYRAFGDASRRWFATAERAYTEYTRP